MATEDRRFGRIWCRARLEGKVQETRPKIKRYEATEIEKIKVLRAEMQIWLNYQAIKLIDLFLILLYGAQRPSIFLLGSLLLDRR